MTSGIRAEVRAPGPKPGACRDAFCPVPIGIKFKIFKNFGFLKLFWDFKEGQMGISKVRVKNTIETTPLL